MDGGSAAGEHGARHAAGAEAGRGADAETGARVAARHAAAAAVRTRQLGETAHLPHLSLNTRTPSTSSLNIPCDPSLYSFAQVFTHRADTCPPYSLITSQPIHPVDAQIPSPIWIHTVFMTLLTAHTSHLIEHPTSCRHTHKIERPVSFRAAEVKSYSLLFFFNLFFARVF